MGQGHDIERMKNDDGQWEYKCVHCGRLCTSRRYDASFCNAACRVGYQRAQEQLRYDIASIPSRARSIRTLAERNPKANGMFEALMKAQSEIRKALESLEVTEQQLSLWDAAREKEVDNLILRHHTPKE